jgi:hypothetical protein
MVASIGPPNRDWPQGGAASSDDPHVLRRHPGHRIAVDDRAIGKPHTCPRAGHRRCNQADGGNGVPCKRGDASIGAGTHLDGDAGGGDAGDDSVDPVAVSQQDNVTVGRRGKRCRSERESAHAVAFEGARRTPRGDPRRHAAAKLELSGNPLAIRQEQRALGLANRQRRAVDHQREHPGRIAGRGVGRHHADGCVLCHGQEPHGVARTGERHGIRALPELRHLHRHGRLALVVHRDGYLRVAHQAHPRRRHRRKERNGGWFPGGCAHRAWLVTSGRSEGTASASA